jgi:hypothetical protein
MSAMRIGVLVVVYVLLSATCFVSIASAQINWQKAYGGSASEIGLSVQQTTDGGYIVAGRTSSFGPYPSSDNVYLIKTNAQGDTLWTRAYGGPSYDAGFSVQQTTDGGYIIAGETFSLGAEPWDVYLIKTDASGDTLWTRTYGGPAYDQGLSVQQTTDGGYIVAGRTQSFGAGGADAYLIRTDAAGDTLWTRTYGGPNSDVGNSVQQTTDGGYIVVGDIQPTDTGYSDLYLTKTDAQGDTLWTRTYGGVRDDQGYSVQQTIDGGYIIAGTTRSFGRDRRAWLLKTNASGDTVWTRTYVGGFDDARQTTDGGYIAAGSTPLGPGNGEVYLVRTDSSGDTLWTRTYGRKYEEYATSVQQTADGAYIMAGFTSFGVEPNDVYLIKTNGKLDVGPVAIQSPPGVTESGSVYVPRAAVRNFGLTSGTVIRVTMGIGSGYAETVQETLATVPLTPVVFPPWTAEPVGPAKVTCFTSLVGDEDPTNDTIRDSVQVLPPPWHDIGAVAIVSPSGSVRAGDTVMPRARIRNFGNREERFFDVRLRIGAAYTRTVNVAEALLPDSTGEVTFPPWVAETGDWAVSCSTMLGSDADSANDKIGSSVQVFEQTLAIQPDQSGRVEAGKGKLFSFRALIQGEAGGVVEVARPSPPPGWSLRLCDATGVNDLTDTDGDGIPDLGYVAPGDSGRFSLEVTAPSELRGDTAALSQVTFLLVGHVGGRRDIADTAVLALTLVPELSIHNYPNPFSNSTSFVIGLPEDGKASLTIYTRAGQRVCRVLENRDMTAGVHVVSWEGVNDNGRTIAPGTYEYLLDYAHAGKTDRLRKKLVLTKE